MELFTCLQNQTSESDGNNKTTLEKGGRNPPDVTLDDIATDLLSFLTGLRAYVKQKNDIEEKYDIKHEDGDYWSADDIKRAWGKTQRMDKKSEKRKHWACVIILQMLERFMVYGACKPNAAQEDHDDTTNDINQSCETRPGMKENSEDGSAKRKTEPETVGAAGGVEQMSGEGIKVSEVSSLSEDSGVASGSQLSASSTDVSPSPTEVNPIANLSKSGTKNAALMNEDEDTLVNCEQRKDVDDYELYVTNTLDPEDETWEDSLGSTDDINQACGKAESIKGNSEDRSTHGNDDLKTEIADKGVRHHSGGKHSVSNGQTHIGTQGGTGTQIPAGKKDTANDSGAVNSQSGADISAAPSNEKKKNVDQFNCISIPLSMFPSEPTNESPNENTNADPNEDTNSDYTYNLIDQLPSETQQVKLYRKKSYVMLYDTDKKNAQWVYEILNKSTLPYHYKKETFKKDDKIDDDKQALDSKNGFKNKDYIRGHLAAAANHTWCQEAYKDTYLISNMTPQINSINNGIWKTLENYCRKIIYKDDEVRNVHVYTGPLYLNTEVSPIKGKEVPTHFFKVVILENVNGKAKVECHLVENKKIESNATDDKSTDHKEKKGAKKQKQTSKLLTLKEFEEMSGLIFTHVSDNNKVTVKKTLRFTGEKGRKQATIEVLVST